MKSRNILLTLASLVALLCFGQSGFAACVHECWWSVPSMGYPTCGAGTYKIAVNNTCDHNVVIVVYWELFKCCAANQLDQLPDDPDLPSTPDAYGCAYSTVPEGTTCNSPYYLLNLNLIKSLLCVCGAGGNAGGKHLLRVVVWEECNMGSTPCSQLVNKCFSDFCWNCTPPSGCCGGQAFRDYYVIDNTASGCCP